MLSADCSHVIMIKDKCVLILIKSNTRCVILKNKEPILQKLYKIIILKQSVHVKVCA